MKEKMTLLVGRGYTDGRGMLCMCVCVRVKKEKETTTTKREKNKEKHDKTNVTNNKCTK